MAMTPTPTHNIVGKNTTAASLRSPDSNAILAVALELIAIGTFTLIAGINHDFGSLMIIFMVGLWLIFLIQESSMISHLESLITTV